jgi:hypothetical protein
LVERVGAKGDIYFKEKKNDGVKNKGLTGGENPVGSALPDGAAKRGSAGAVKERSL